MLPDKQGRAKHNYRDEHHILGLRHQRSASPRIENTAYSAIIFKLPTINLPDRIRPAPR